MKKHPSKKHEHHEHHLNRKSLHKVFLVMLAVIGIFDAIVSAYLVYLLVVAYFGFASESSIDGLAFIIAIYLYIIIGIPATVITFLVWLGWRQTDEHHSHAPQKHDDLHAHAPIVK